LAYDALSLGTGRKANVEHLGLETAGVRFGSEGVEADEYLHTSNLNIYAAGDVASPQKFTQAAIATARRCAANALDGANRRARELVIPHCTYTDPEVAQVGLTPHQAREEGIPIDEYRLELARVERTFIDGEDEGFAAMYTRRGSGEIIGATLVAAHAGEMISELTLAMTHKVRSRYWPRPSTATRRWPKCSSGSLCSTPVPARPRRLPRRRIQIAASAVSGLPSHTICRPIQWLITPWLGSSSNFQHSAPTMEVTIIGMISAVRQMRIPGRSMFSSNAIPKPRPISAATAAAV
jgi:hypothetical protein